jgi:hypothetical protein
MANEQPNREQNAAPTPANSKQTSDQAEHVESAFKLKDLSRLTFRLDAAQALDCWSSTAAQFQTYVQKIVKKVDNVDTSIWTPFERLDFLNGVYDFCQKRGVRFPFFVKPLQPPVERSEDEPTSKKA